MATSDVNARVQKHRRGLRVAGLRPIQIWVPDTRRPGFAEECRRQCLLASKADTTDPELEQFMTDVANDIDGWTD